eukprot:COSAG05_NODE_1116_length_5825_cov_11.050304_10_plen_112_part_01
MRCLARGAIGALALTARQAFVFAFLAVVALAAEGGDMGGGGGDEVTSATVVQNNGVLSQNAGDCSGGRQHCFGDDPWYIVTIVLALVTTGGLVVCFFKLRATHKREAMQQKQ